MWFAESSQHLLWCWSNSRKQNYSSESYRTASTGQSHGEITAFHRASSCEFVCVCVQRERDKRNWNMNPFFLLFFWGQFLSSVGSRSAARARPVLISRINSCLASPPPFKHFQIFYLNWLCAFAGTKTEKKKKRARQYFMSVNPLVTRRCTNAIKVIVT